jgi:hypothetical protein
MRDILNLIDTLNESEGLANRKPGTLFANPRGDELIFQGVKFYPEGGGAYATPEEWQQTLAHLDTLPSPDQGAFSDKIPQPLKDAFGGVGKVAEGAESALNKIGASKLTERLGISDAITKSRQFAANLTKGQEGPISMGAKIGNQFKVLGNLAGNIGGNLIKSLGPVPLILGGIVKLAQFFVESMFAASVQVAEFQRDMGLTAEDAEDLRQRT